MYALFVRCKKEYNVNEWLLYHLSIGFSHVYIYDDFVTEDSSVKLIIDERISSDDYTIIDNQMINIDRSLGLNSRVFYDAIFEIIKQNNHKYLMHLDMDEYLFLHEKFNDVNDFISHYEPFDHLYVNWCLFGNSNIKTLPEISDTPYTLLDKFIYSDDKLSNHGKSIVKLDSLKSANNPHFFLIKPKKICKDVWNNVYNNVNDSLFRIQTGNITCRQQKMLNDMDVTYVAHYVIQTTERFVKRRFLLNSERITQKLVITSDNINQIIDIVHDTDYNKIHLLKIDDENKKTLKKIINFYEHHNKNIKLNFHGNAKTFILENKNNIYPT